MFFPALNEEEPCFAIAQLNNHLHFKLEKAEILSLLFTFGRVLMHLWIPIYRFHAHSSIRMDYTNFVNTNHNTALKKHLKNGAFWSDENFFSPACPNIICLAQKLFSNKS